MNEQQGNSFAIILLTLLSFFTGMAIGQLRVLKRLHKEAIECGVAEYCPQTGDWQWKLTLDSGKEE